MFKLGISQEVDLYSKYKRRVEVTESLEVHEAKLDVLCSGRECAEPHHRNALHRSYLQKYSFPAKLLIATFSCRA